MEQYIPKAAVVAEIKRSKDEYLKYCKNKFHAEWSCGTLDNILSFLDTLEVKEVDLEKELESWRHNHFHGRRDKEASGEYLERVSQLELAKHFFELGLKAQKGEEV